MLLGADLSTSICGISVLDDDGKLVLSEAIDLRNKNKYKTLNEKADCVRKHLTDIATIYPIEKVYIEKSLFMFTSGKSSVTTLFLLAGFNTLVSYFCYDIFKVEPEYISATTARKRVGIVLDKSQDTKKQIVDFARQEPGFSVSWTPSGNYVPSCADRADAWVVAKACWMGSKSAKSSRKAKDTD